MKRRILLTMIALIFIIFVGYRIMTFEKTSYRHRTEEFCEKNNMDFRIIEKSGGSSMCINAEGEAYYLVKSKNGSLSLLEGSFPSETNASWEIKIINGKEIKYLW